MTKCLNIWQHADDHLLATRNLHCNAAFISYETEMALSVFKAASATINWAKIMYHSGRSHYLLRQVACAESSSMPFWLMKWHFTTHVTISVKMWDVNIHTRPNNDCWLSYFNAPVWPTNVTVGNNKSAKLGPQDFKGVAFLCKITGVYIFCIIKMSSQ